MKLRRTIAVLITCHNRKLKTLQCLKNLYAQQGINLLFKLDIYLVDDNSTDGTFNEINLIYPNVNLIKGNGYLYWNRGMHLAWKTAVATKEYDYYLWLNDDTFLYENAINDLLLKQSKNEIICGTTRSAISDFATYGGYNNPNKKILFPNGKFQSVDYCNGNFVLIPNAVFKIVGNLDPFFHHAIGDFDYTLRAKKFGVKLYVAPNFIGTCESHSSEPRWRSTSEKLTNRLRLLYAPTSGCHPFQYFVFDKRHNGFFLASLHFMSIHLRAVIPKLWK